jgi:hypothetical protein
MAGAKDSKPAVEVVAVPFAYAKAKSGQVVQLVKGDAIDADRYEKGSLEHLRGIGFISSK